MMVPLSLEISCKVRSDALADLQAGGHTLTAACLLFRLSRALYTVPLDLHKTNAEFEAIGIQRTLLPVGAAARTSCLDDPQRRERCSACATASTRHASARTSPKQTFGSRANAAAAKCDRSSQQGCHSTRGTPLASTLLTRRPSKSSRAAERKQGANQPIAVLASYSCVLPSESQRQRRQSKLNQPTLPKCSSAQCTRAVRSQISAVH